jgi:hypothetical protein
MSFFKTLFKSNQARFDEITPKFLAVTRSQYSGEKYLRWLKDTYGALQVILLRQETKTGSVPQGWKDKIGLLEQSIDEAKSRMS